MMFQLEKYINDLICECKNIFEERLLYVGLQGSYLRKEAHENSDIDIMVIIDDMTIHDLNDYRNILMLIGYFEKSCGFICGKEELQNWNPLEICQLLHTTKDYYGKLKDFAPSYTYEDERNYVKLSLGNLYHELCHRYIHSDKKKNEDKLPMTCKSIFFIIQNIYYLNNGIFITTKQELLECVKGEDKRILKMTELLKNSSEYNFDEVFADIFQWCKKTLIHI